MAEKKPSRLAEFFRRAFGLEGKGLKEGPNLAKRMELLTLIDRIPMEHDQWARHADPEERKKIDYVASYPPRLYLRMLLDLKHYRNIDTGFKLDNRLEHEAREFEKAAKESELLRRSREGMAAAHRAVGRMLQEHQIHLHGARTTTIRREREAA